MKKYNFDEIANRRNTNSLKWDVLDNELPMWVADMDFKVLPEIQDAILRRASINAFGYSEVPNEYFDSYIKWWSSHHDVNLKRDNLIFVTGVIAGIDTIFKYLLNRGDKVLMFSPNYNVFYSCLKNNGLKPLIYNFEYNNYLYSLDFSKIEELIIANKPKAFLLCNPHNPIGMIFSEEQIKKIITLCEKYNVLLISDEIHCDIKDNDVKTTSVLKYCFYNNIIALLSPSKAFNLAGLQSAVIATFNDKIKDILQSAVYKEDVGEPNFFAVDATIAAFKYGDEYNKELNDYIYNNKKYLTNFIEKEIPSLHVIKGQATYLMWIDISNISNDSETFVKQLREKTGLYVSSGLQYGENGKTFIRINVATSLDNVKKCCQKLKKFVIDK